MNPFKHLLLTLFFACIISFSFGQVTKCKATGCSYKTKNEYTKKWSDWSDLQEVDILITIDFKNDRIKVFSKKDQVYDIIKYYEKETDDENDETFKYLCVNEDGLKCYVRLVKLNSRGGRRQLYVDFSDMMLLYNIYVLD